MRDIVSAIDVRRVIEFDVHNSAPVVQTIDRQGFNSLGLIFDFGSYGDGSVEFTLEGTNDSTTWTELEATELSVALPVFEPNGESPTASDLAESVVKVGVLTDFAVYRLTADSVTSAGNEFGVYAVLGHAAQQPVP